MKFWFTRPDAREYMMGGLRSVMAYAQEPMYYHTPNLDKRRYEVLEPITKKQLTCDLAWMGAGSFSASTILKQNAELRTLVCDEIFTSCCPMHVIGDVYDWANAKHEKESSSTNWDCIKEEEARISWKRFLVEATIIPSITVKVVKPRVHFYHDPRYGKKSDKIIRTNKISRKLAKQYLYTFMENDPSSVPF